MIIGQDNLKYLVKEQIENDIFPRFSLLVGPKGSGKKRFVGDYIQELLDCTCIWYGIKVDDIREMIQQCYKLSEKTLYIMPDADKMSNEAKNALLKVTEEPPNNAYFVMTLEDSNNTLATIRSRGTIYRMENYTPNDLELYYKSEENMPNNTDIEIIRQICATPGDVKTLISSNISEFWKYVQTVVDNIALVSGSNSFKIANRIAFKEGSEGYDIRLFWKAFASICVLRMTDGNLDAKYAKGVIITHRYLNKLNITGIRRDSLFDMWLLDIRKEWM